MPTAFYLILTQLTIVALLIAILFELRSGNLRGHTGPKGDQGEPGHPGHPGPRGMDGRDGQDAPYGGNA